MLRLLAVGLATAALSGCSLPTEGPADALVNSVLMMSTVCSVDDDGVCTPIDARPLDGEVVEGSVFVFLAAGVELREIRFELDGAAAALPTVDRTAVVYEFDTSVLDDGLRTLTAVAGGYRTHGITVVADATFAVRNHRSSGERGEPRVGEGVSEDEAGDEADEGEEGRTGDEGDDGGSGDESPGGDGGVGPPASPDPADPWAEAAGPLVIQHGGTFSGVWQSFDPNVPAITVLTSEPVIIENAFVRGAGHLISAPWSNAHLTVRNVYGEAFAPTIAGRHAGRFLVAEGYRHVVVENSAMVGTSGIYLNASTRGGTVRIVRNSARNIDGRRSDGAGGFSGAHYVQFVQLNAGVDLIGSEIAWNQVINEPFVSRVEDVISLYKTSGRPDDPVRVHHNFIQGAYPTEPVRESYSGGGIMLGDAGGAYLHAFRNTVVSTSNYGLAIAGGHHNRISDNHVVSCGTLPDGATIASQNVGIYIWNIDADPGFGTNVGTGNTVAWAHHVHRRNDWWVPDAHEWSGNVGIDLPAVAPCDLERLAFEKWQDAVAAARITVGPTQVLSEARAGVRADEGLN